MAKWESMWRRRFLGVPRYIVAAVAAEALVLTYGGVVHLTRLVQEWPPYPWAPTWLATYFTSLTFLDPLAAYLLWDRRTGGLYLAAFVLVTDACANWYASYRLPPGTLASRVAQGIIVALALGSLLVAHQARPWMRQPRSDRTLPSN